MRLPALLVILAAVLCGIDCVWVAAGHYQIDVMGYARLSLLAVVLLSASWIYKALRPDPRLAAMLLGTGFLCAFTLGASVLNYLLLSHAGTRIDVPLAALDRALGFDWPRAMTWMARHPILNGIAYIAYASMLPQVAVMTVVLSTVAPPRVYRFVASVAAGALICIAVWSIAPSFGAFSVYANPVPQGWWALDGRYAAELVQLLQKGPGYISPNEAKGLIGFPSYHAVLALLVMWHARVSFLRWPALALNLAVLLATPIQGGHHLMDVLGAVPVTALALFVTRARKYEDVSAKSLSVVNKASPKSFEPAFAGLFRIEAAHNENSDASAIKSKLSRLS